MDNAKQREVLELEAQTEKEIRSKLRANKNKIYAVNLVEHLLKKIDGLVNSATRERKVKFDCKEGCASCCSLRVELWEPEVIYVANNIKNLPQAQQEQIVRDLEIFVAKVKGLTSTERRALNLPCAFLKNNGCSIYNFRPFSCRKWHSLDVNSCNTLAGRVLGDEELFTKSNAVMRGFAKAFERNGLALRPAEFGQALLLALTDDSVLDRWMKGEEVFPALPEYETSQNLFIQSSPKQ